MRKRSIFGELTEGVTAMKGHREGKLTLRSYKVEATPLPEVDSQLLRDTRKKLRCSRAVFARMLRIMKGHWKSGSRTRQAQSAGRRAYPPRPQVSGYPAAAGEASGRVIADQGSRL
jgi:putative transcriptional regulator